MKKTLLLLTIVFFSTASAFADDGGAIQGSNLTWEFITATGTLTISGNGTMPDFTTPPWNLYKNSITNVIIGNGVLSIGSNAFNGCSILPSIIIPTNVNTIGSSAFDYCANLRNVKIQDENTPLNFDSYYNNIFSNCPCDTVYLGRNLQTGNSSIGNPFSGLPVKILTIGNKVTKLNDYSFSDCKQLQLINWGSGLETIGSNAFYNCVNLATQLDIPQGVIEVWSQAFKNCSALPSVIIPSSAKTIGSSAFDYCANLKNVKIQDENTPLNFDSYYNNIFSNCSCDTVYLGRNLQTGNSSIGNPFSGLPVKILTIGNHVTKLDDYSFYGCSGLSQITSHPCPAPSIGNNTFSGVNKSIPVYVNCCSAYQSAQFWNEFTNYRNIDTQEPCNVGIVEMSRATSPRVFPNPTTGELTITNYELGIGTLSEVEVEIFDIYGKKQSSHHLIPSSSNHHINISHLSAGIYFLKIGNETVKVVKQ